MNWINQKKLINVLAFDIETIPDIANIRKIYALGESLSAHEVTQWIQQKRRAETGHDFLPLYLQQVVAISCCFRWSDKIHVNSIGVAGDSEKVIIQKFFELFEKYELQLVSWNGNGFDLPVLRHRALINQVVARNYWDMGDFDNQNKWHNYINRYQMKHCDLMDVLAGYQAKGFAPLDNMAKICGFPGKLGMDGSQVWDAFQAGKIEEIRNYCETDAMNTYLIFLRFQLMRGLIIEEEYIDEISLLKYFLKQQAKNHFLEFLNHFSD